MQTPRTRLGIESGFTILEMAISTVILVSIFMLAFRVIGGAQSVLGTSSITMANTQVAHLTEMMLQRMRNGVVATLQDSAGVPIPDGGKSTTGFRIRLVAQTPSPMYLGGLVLGETVGFTLRPTEAVNGIDDNHNNIVDENEVMLQKWPLGPVGPPQFSPFIEDNVRSLTISRTGSRILITLVMERYDATNRQIKVFTGTSSFALRN
jgi:hypothetical protein